MKHSKISNDKFIEYYGPWALVTGASDGIGREMALEIARKGLNLILVARRKDSLDVLSQEIRNSSGVEVITLSLDLSLENATEELKQQSQKYDIGLFAPIAGFGSSGPFVDQQIAQELNMIDVNCKAVVAQTYYFANRFKKRLRGGIILMGSLVGFQGVPNSATYAGTKAFIQSFAEALYFELAEFGVHVLSSAPGPVLSGFAVRAHMKMTQGTDVKIVAKKTLESLGLKLTIRPGFMSKFLGWSLIILPRYWRIRIMKIIMSSMSTHP